MGKIIIRVLSISLIFVFMAGLLPSWLCATETDLLVAGVPANSPPHIFQTKKNNQPEGLAIDLMEHVARHAGLRVRYQVFDTWDELIEAFGKGEVDVIPSLGISEKRKPGMVFTVPYEACALLAFVRHANIDITSVDDLAGRSVGVVAAERGEAHMENRGHGNLTVYESTEAALLALLSGRVDALVHQEQSLMIIAKESGLHKRIKPVGGPLEEVMRAMAVPNDRPELFVKLNGALLEFVGTPEFKVLYTKWHAVAPPFWSVGRVVAGMVFLIALLLVSFFFMRSQDLRRINRKIDLFKQKGRQADMTIQTLVESMVGVTGQECLDQIVAGLCQWLGVDCCMIGKVVANGSKVQALAARLDGEKIDEMEYPIKGSPCEKVSRGGYCIYPERVCELFPESRELAQLGAQGYIGTPICDREGRIIGALNAISRKPLKMPAMVKEAMDILAARAAAEIDRNLVEEAMQRELKLNRALAELSGRIISAHEKIEVVVQLVLDRAMELTGSAHGLVTAIDFKTKENICQSHTAMFQDVCPLRQAVDQEEGDGEPHAGGASPCEKILSSADSFYTNNPASHPAFAVMPTLSVPLERFLTVPVQGDQEFLGRILLANPGRDYNVDDLAVIERLAELYALAILNQRAADERELLAAELRHTQKLEAIGTLAGGIAHDFNNILSAILGYSELAKDEVPEDSQIGKDLDEVINAGRRARELVKQILTFSRQTEQEKRPLQLSHLLKEACKLLRSTVSSSIDIAQNIDDSSAKVLADPVQIHQLLMNLATNAVEAMGEKGVLEVSLTDKVVREDEDLSAWPNNLVPGRYVALAVRDNGPGIDQTTIARIFDPFFTTRDVGRASGMGLPVVMGIVQNHKALITVESEPAHGCLFQVFFPAFEEVAQVEAEDSPILPSGTESILYVDDELTLVNMGKQFLERQGYRVQTATNSVAALEVFRSMSEKYDLVIVDQTMPNMTGLELIAELLAIRADLPVILTYGYGAVVSDERAKAAGVWELILKPIVLGDLARTVRRVLDS